HLDRFGVRLPSRSFRRWLDRNDTPGGDMTAAANGRAEIRLQVIWHRLLALVEEQAQTLMRTAFSSTVREAGDLAAGVFDPQGRMLAQAVTGTPGHVNTMADAVGHFLARFPVDSMQPGDQFVT